SLLGEEPLEHFGVVVGLVPNVVAFVREFRVLWATAGLLQRRDHLARRLDRLGGVFGPVKNPDGNLGELRRSLRFAPAADGNGRRDLVGITFEEGPHAPTAIGNTRNVYALGVDAMFPFQVLDHLHDDAAVHRFGPEIVRLLL